MLTHPTLDQMHRLGLAGMMRAFTQLEADPRAAELSHAEWLGLLLDREMTERQDRRLKARLRFARLRHQATIEDVDYRAPRGLDRGLFQKLAPGRLDRRSAEPNHRRANRRRQKLACLCPRPQSVPRQPVRPLPAHPAALHRSGAGSW